MEQTLSASPTYATDKTLGYLPTYETLFAHLRDQQIVLLELGVHRGGSLHLWRDWFPHGTIIGLDVNPVVLTAPMDRIRVYQGLQQDLATLTRIANEQAPDGFDVIIDDASHLGELTKVSFWHLFDRHLKPGGIYVIEDWGTGYWSTWPDGRQARGSLTLWQRLERWLARRGWRQGMRLPSHDYGMVGLVKQLIDEQGYEELSRPGYGQPSERRSRFKSMLVTDRLVAITKHTCGGKAAVLSRSARAT
jgi:SAM-dependent methyltransferase